MDAFAWQPTGNYLEGSRVRKFMDLHGILPGRNLSGGQPRISNGSGTPLWNTWELNGFRQYTRLYDDSLGMPWTTWFLGGKLNIVHNCLDRHIRDGRGAATALWFESDDGSQAP